MHVRRTDSSLGWEAMLLTKRSVEFLERSYPPLVRVLQPLANRGQSSCSFLLEIRLVGVRVISVFGGMRGLHWYFLAKRSDHMAGISPLVCADQA
jgi:hypothetical protein